MHPDAAMLVTPSDRRNLITDITGYVNLALLLLGVWFVLSVQGHVKKIAADVRAIRLAQVENATPPVPAHEALSDPATDSHR
jgi:hypothetical protein